LKAFVFLCVVSGSVSTAAFAEDKIAVLDIQRAMLASNFAQNKIKTFQESSDIVALNAKLEGSAADLNAMAEEAQAKSMTWSSEEAADHQKKMAYARADYDLAVKKLQGESQQLEKEIPQELGQQLQEAMNQVVKEEGITVLLRRESVLIANPKNQITAKVVDRLNQLTDAKE
jgi:outer membrane protein